MRCKVDFSDVQAVVDGFKADVKRELDRVGGETVERARREADFHDVTGRLRNSYTHEATTDKLVLENTAPYASHVEARGRKVLATFALEAEAQLRELFKR